MYDNYVFDLYGTLADIRTDEWDNDVWKILAKFYKDEGAKYYYPEEIRNTYGMFIEEEKADVHKRHPEYEHIDIQIEKVFRKMYENRGVAASDELVLKTASFFRTTTREYIRLYPGIRELLDALKKCGKVYLLTNAQRSFTWEELEILDIVKDFDDIIISSDEECCKPDIHFFKKLIDRHKLDPSKTIMVGNDPNTDVRGGIGAGFDTLYIHSNISPAIDYNSGCTYFIPDGDSTKMKDYLI